MFVFLQISFVLCVALANGADDCKKIFKESDPSKCVSMPSPMFNTAQSQNFEKKMKDNEDDDCARLDAAFETTGIWDGSKFSTDKFVKAYETSLVSRSAEDKKLWMAVVEKSIQLCEKAVPNSNKKSFCKTPEYVFTIRDCVRQQNFLDSPKAFFNASKSCEDVKKFLSGEKCGVKYGNLYIVDNEYWQKE